MDTAETDHEYRFWLSMDSNVAKRGCFWGDFFFHQKSFEEAQAVHWGTGGPIVVFRLTEAVLRWTRVCQIGNLASEISDISEGFRLGQATHQRGG